MGFIAMKGMSGGLITKSAAAFAFLDQPQYSHVLPIWGVQRESELDEFLSYMMDPPGMTEEIKIDRDRPGSANRRFLPRLRILYAVSCRNRNKQLCAYVAYDKARTAVSTADSCHAGKNDENRRMSALRAVQQQVPLRT